MEDFLFELSITLAALAVGVMFVYMHITKNQKR